MKTKKIVVASSGASGANLGLKILELMPKEIEKHFILTKSAEVVLDKEMGVTLHEHDNIAASISSGSFGVDAMIIAPCSMNTLAKIAAEGTSVAAAKDFFKGPIGIAISHDDPVTIVKKMLEFSKKNNKLKVGIGLIEGSLCTTADLKTVAEIPPRPVLLSMLAGVFQAPLSKMASALNATVSKVAYALEAVKNKKQES